MLEREEGDMDTSLQDKIKKLEKENAHLRKLVGFINEQVPVDLKGITTDQELYRKLHEAVIEEQSHTFVKSEIQFGQIVNQVRDIIALVDSSGTITYISPIVETIMGYTQDEIVNTKIFELLRPDDIKFAYDRFGSFILESKKNSVIEVRIKHKNGLYRNIEIVSNNQLHNPDILAVVITLRDITEKKEMESRIFRAILETEEKERRQFAQNLHDDIGPLLSTLNIYISSFTESIPKDEKMQYICSKVKEIVKEAMQNVRDLSYSMSPSILSNFGLHRAVLNTINRNNELIEISYRSNIENIRIELNTETVYYRILNEMVNNTIKHASAKKIDINLFYNDNILNLEYQDDGIGIEMDIENFTKESLGMNNILSRIKLINGTYTIESNAGKGFKFKLKSEAKKN